MVLFGLLTAAATSGPTALLPHCAEATARLDVALSSASNAPGDSFRFTLLDPVRAYGRPQNVTGGARGYGIVAYVRHAAGGGTPGMLVLEPRYVIGANGAHVPVMAEPGTPNRLARGKTKDAPDALGLVPVVGFAVGGYNALHRGKDITLGKGSLFTIVIGDDLAGASCFVPGDAE